MFEDLYCLTMTDLTLHLIYLSVLDMGLLTDSLVLNLQLVHDGDLLGWPGEHDFDEDTSQGLRTLQQGR